MTILRMGIAGLLLVAGTGCASTPADLNTAPRAKHSSAIDPALLVESSDKGSVRLVRDRGIVGAGISVLIYLDGRHVANIDANRVLELYVPTGVRRLGLQVNSVTEPIQYQELSVEAGKKYDYRIRMSGNGLTSDWHMERLN